MSLRTDRKLSLIHIYAVDAPGVKRLAPEQIRGDLEDSLLNLKTDYIDLYYLHQDDPLRDVGEIIDVYKRQGVQQYQSDKDDPGQGGKNLSVHGRILRQ